MSLPTQHLKLTKPDGVEAYNVALLNTNYDIIDAAYNALPKGIQAASTYTGSTSDFTNRIVVATLGSVTFTKGRRYVIHLDASFHANNQDTILQLDISKDSNLAASATSLDGIVPVVADLDAYYTVKTAMVGVNFPYSVLYTPANTETVQVKLTAKRESGSGSLWITGYQWYVEDKGLAI